MSRFTADQLPAKYQAQVSAQLHGKPTDAQVDAFMRQFMQPKPTKRAAKIYTNETNHPTSSPVLERDSRPRPLAAGQTQEGNPARFLVRVTSYRRRLLDEDNLCEKYFCDCCRYAGLLPEDSADVAKIEVCQIKVAHKHEEKTVIEITP